MIELIITGYIAGTLLVGWILIEAIRV